MTNIVERLRGSPFEWLADEIARRDAEVERLTAKAENWQRIATEITASEHAQRLDNERLRAALQEISDFPHVGAQASQKIWGIARRALEPKP